MKSKLLVITFLLSAISSYSQNNPIINDSGNVLLFAMPIITAGYTIAIKDKKGSIQFLKGLVVNEALTEGVKLVINKRRPDGSNTNSFPSGHTSTTFQSAAFIQKRYGLKYGIPAYLLASYAGYTRIYSDKHYFVDVLAGAIIGVGSSYLFTTPYQKEHLELTFSNDNKNYLLGFKYTF